MSQEMEPDRRWADTEPARHTERTKGGRIASDYQIVPDGIGAVLAKALSAAISGEVRFDDGSRALYATDASNYRQVPSASSSRARSTTSSPRSRCAGSTAHRSSCVAAARASLGRAATSPCWWISRNT